jgi:TRAP-type C4-dicarboxylate transport system permease small subunit
MIDRIITKIEWGITCVTFLFASLLAFCQVVLRWISKFNPDFINHHTFDLLQWSPELINYLLITGALIGGSIGVKTNTHIGVDVLIKKLPNKLSFWISVATHVLSTGFMLYICYYGFYYILSEKEKGLLPEHLPGQLWLYHSPMVLAFLLIAFRFSQKTTDLVRKQYFDGATKGVNSNGSNHSRNRAV